MRLIRIPEKSTHKFRAKATEIDGIKFASKAEATRYSELKLLERARQIEGLELQPKFRMVVNDALICTYIADFAYRLPNTDRKIVEDVKSPATRTEVYRLKIKLLAALHGIEVTEVQRS